jgi:hypothetical protein
VNRKSSRKRESVVRQNPLIRDYFDDLWPVKNTQKEGTMRDRNILTESAKPAQVSDCEQLHSENLKRSGERKVRKEILVVELAKAGVSIEVIREVLGILEMW